MDMSRLTPLSEYAWRIEPHGEMRVPVIIYGDRDLIQDMDDKVYQQAVNVAGLPGIIGNCYAMPDAHWGYGFPIGGVAAFDPSESGVVSAGGVGFDISCGVRTLTTGLKVDEIDGLKHHLADALYADIPVGVGSKGKISLGDKEMDAMLSGGAEWAIDKGYGSSEDLDRIEERGRMKGAQPEAVSSRAKARQKREMGTLGSGNHYLEVQGVSDILDEGKAQTFGVSKDDVVISIHCGSRGLGHQIGTEFLKEMVISASEYGIKLPDRELACSPIDSPLGRRYLGAMRAAINCALANRQIITHLTRRVFSARFPNSNLSLLYDVSHNTCKVEEHVVAGERKRLFVHRKGATRAFGPGHPDIPPALRAAGQPVLIGGSMGTASYILAGTEHSETLSMASACHGAGRGMSRRQARKTWSGRQIVDELASRGIIVRSPSQRGVAEEAPGAYKDVDVVVEAADRAQLACRVAKLQPLVCVKG